MGQKRKRRKPKPKGPTRAKKQEALKPGEEPPAVSEEQRRYRLIRDLMRDHKRKGSPRDHVVITRMIQILDISGVYQVRASLPSDLAAGNHVWVREYIDGRETARPVIVVEDHVIQEGEDGPQEMVMVRDDPRTKEWVVPRFECAPLPLTMNPMLIHKSKLDHYLGEGWAEVFWDHRRKRRRVKPTARVIQRIQGGA
jgi:hypothetical protein